MAAASSDVSGSKSGKGGGRLADGEDYKWAFGRYTKCQQSNIFLKNGGVIRTNEGECDGENLVIERLGDNPKGLTFQATLGSTLRWRRFYEGVGSYNPQYIHEITFYCDHYERFNGTSWVTGHPESDVSTMRVSQLDGNSSSVVVDLYTNNQDPPHQFERITTFLFTDVDSE